MKAPVPLLLLFALASGIVPSSGQESVVSFGGPTALAGWTLQGDAAVDAAKDRGAGAGGALRLGPGARAIRKLRDSDGAGRVEFWVYEDGTKPANPKERRAGPRWGLLQSDGRVLVAGAIYAPYLAGDTSYAASDSDQKNWFVVQHLGLARKPGWHRWTFDFDAQKGLALLYDGKDVNAGRKRFDWNKTQIKGFSGVAFFGDSGKGSEQTIWVDDLSAQLGGSVQAQPVAPPPPAPVVPETDPAPEKPVDLVPAVKGKHPRLLFTAAEIPAMKALAAGEEKGAYERLLAYLPACKPPVDTAWQKDATDAQRQGIWRLPTVALHYVLTGDKKSLDSATGFLRKFLETADWETGEERNSGMASANILAGAALAYDWLYNDLDPQFREAFRRKLLLMARWQYYAGHLNGNKATAYWQNDAQNNHRWHRDAGLTLSALAVAGDGPGGEWLLAKTREELEFVCRWLPEDGTSHESPSYMIFGMPYLALACDASDRCLGTSFLRHPYFKTNPLFRLQTITPGFRDSFCYGDAAGLGFINDYLYCCTAANRSADLQAAVKRFEAVDPGTTFDYGWFSLVWYDPSLKGGSLDNLPRSALFPDLGAAFMRDGWEAGNAAAMFKCGPYGGFKLNEFRNQTGSYINIAHDDPDCNMFLLFGGGKLLADDDRYAYNKVTRSHNTLLVNGKGQRGEGRGHWLQPVKNADMATFARVTTWKETPRLTAVEGEAGNAYVGLDRYRRSFLWVPGDYVLLLDDIRGKGEVGLTWLVQAPGVETVEAAQGRYLLKNDPAACPFQVAADRPFTGAIVDSTADHRGKPLGFKQLQLQARGAQWRLASVFDLWNRKGLKVELTPNGPDAATVTVTGSGFADTWSWQAAPDANTPSTLRCERRGFTVGAGDKVAVP